MKKIALILMTFILLTSLTNFVVAHTGDDNSVHHMMFGTYGWWIMGFFMLIFMVLIIVALFLLIVWLIKQIEKPKRRRRK